MKKMTAFCLSIILSFSAIYGNKVFGAEKFSDINSNYLTYDSINK